MSQQQVGAGQVMTGDVPTCIMLCEWCSPQHDVPVNFKLASQ